MQRIIRQMGERVVERKLLEVLASDETERVEEAREEALSKRAQAAVDAAESATTAQQEIEQQQERQASATTPPAIREMVKGEDCPVCSAMLASVAEMDEPRRTKGVAEYGEFRGALAEGEEEATAVLEDAEVLPDALDGVREVSP